MLRRLLARVRSQPLALIALFVALGGTAYAATAYVQAPQGGSGRSDFVSTGISPSDKESKLLKLPGLGKFVITCKSSANEMDIDFISTSSGLINVWDNIGATTAHALLTSGDRAPLLAVATPVAAVVGDVHVDSISPGGRGAVVHIAADRALAQSSCIVHAQYELLTK